MAADNIFVKKIDDLGDRWVIEAAVSMGADRIEYTVTLLKDYWQKLTGGRVQPTKLIEETFGFLLKHESKETIMRKFHLSQIKDFYPDYEKEIMKGAGINPET